MILKSASGDELRFETLSESSKGVHSRLWVPCVKCDLSDGQERSAFADSGKLIAGIGEYDPKGIIPRTYAGVYRLKIDIVGTG